MKLPSKDITIPVDEYGQVIYFTVNGRSFFFNGNSGFFSDTLPGFADEAFLALRKNEKERSNIFSRLITRHGSPCQALVDEIESIKDGSHPDLEPETSQGSFFQPGFPQDIDVFLSETCNMACRYCFNERGSAGGHKSLMSVKTAQNTLKFIANLVKSGKGDFWSVNLIGGEPLLNPKAVYILARGLQDLNHARKGSPVRLFLATNGTIYNKRIFNIFAECPDVSRVVVSLDGLKDVQDLNRPFSDKRKGASYDCVVRNLKRIIHEGIPHRVTCVVACPYNFIGASDELHNLGVESLEIKQVITYILGKHPFPEDLQGDFKAWRENYLNYLDYCLEYLYEAKPVRHLDRISVFNKYASCLKKGVDFVNTISCGVGDATIAIDCNGAILPCMSFIGHKRFSLGNVSEGFDTEALNKFQKWLIEHGQHRINDRECKYCFAKRICGGGCYALSYDRFGTLGPYLDQCTYAKEMVKLNLYYISGMKRLHPDKFVELTGAKLSDKGN